MYLSPIKALGDASSIFAILAKTEKIWIPDYYLGNDNLNKRGIFKWEIGCHSEEGIILLKRSSR